MIPTSKEAAREYAVKYAGGWNANRDGDRLSNAHLSGQQHILDTLAEMAREHEIEIAKAHMDDWNKNNGPCFSAFTNGAHFGFILGKASIQGEVDVLKIKYDKLYERDSEDGQWYHIKIRELNDQLTQRDAEIKKLQEQIIAGEAAFKALRGEMIDKDWKIIDCKSFPMNYEKLSHNRSFMLELCDLQKEEIKSLNEMVEVMENGLIKIKNNYPDPQIASEFLADETLTKISELRKKL